ncbi:unnamed protein product [Brachionus calyciflorus]|uniref:Uncharacterized protein n=1 Tax=Brachionus calyciflorus TaxID=104777 RepID=A0A813Q2D9_9BILA|nr:unnamed protein product [Brachionus calyciflorus]
MDNNLSNYNPSLNNDDSRVDLSKLVEKDSIIASNSQFQMSNNPEKKATHSEIEKRRRQKMNKHLNELVFHLPMTMNKNKKPDKITVLKMAVQHMKNLKASSSILSDSFLCQNYITPFELQTLVLKENEEFLIVIKCDSSKILYASETCSNCLGFHPSELVDKVFFEIVHPSDSKQVKDQLTYYDQANAMGSVSNFMLNKTKTFTTGDRRSFICRIRTGPYQDSRQSSMQDHVYTNLENKKPEYKTVQFAGYLRSDLSANLKFSPETQSEQTPTGLSQTNLLSPSLTSSSESSVFLNNLNNSNTAKLNSFKNFHSITLLNEQTHLNNDANQLLNTTPNSNSADAGPQIAQTGTSISSNSSTNVLEYYLIAYGQISPKIDETSKHKYTSRHDQDGKFIYLEPGVQSLIGYLPHQLLSESLFNHVHTDDINLLKKAFQEITSSNNLKNKIRTREYRFRLENNTYVTLQSVLYALQNPFNDQLEYIVAQNTLISTPVNFFKDQKTPMSMPTPKQIYQKNPFLQQHHSINSQTISMPMTPSPEEIFNNETNSNLNLNEFPNTSKNLSNNSYNLQHLNQKNVLMSPNMYHTNRNLSQQQQQQQQQQQHFRPMNSQVLYQNQMDTQKIQNSNYIIYNQQQLNPVQIQQNDSKMNMVYPMVDTNSFANNFINSESEFDLNNRIYNQNQVQTASTNCNNDETNNWMLQLFDNTDSNQQDLNFTNKKN